MQLPSDFVSYRRYRRNLLSFAVMYDRFKFLIYANGPKIPSASARNGDY